MLMEPSVLLAGREVDVRLRPASRPVVLQPVEAGAAQPVAQRQLLGVVDPQPPLLRRIHHEESAE